MEVHTATSIQDRTFEFQQAVNTFARQGQVQITKKKNNNTNSIPKNEFNKEAGKIAKEIVHVTGALSKLAQLAKRKQLFGDKPTDIVELTYIIKQDIFRIEKELKSLKLLQNKGTNNSDAQMAMYNKNVVQLLNTKTKNISEDFKEVLQARQRTEMLQRSRQEQLLAAVKSTTESSELIQRNSSENIINGNNVPYAVRAASKLAKNNINSNDVIRSDNPFLASMNMQEFNENEVATANAAAIASFGSSTNNNMLSLPDQNQQLMLLEEQNNQYIQERSNAVDVIESTINEVGGLFQQLATMVQEQGEVIQRIDDNVEDVSLNITGAQRELMKYYHNVSSNRWLMLKIFGVLIVFFLLWVLVS
jgi:syntaxin 5